MTVDCLEVLLSAEGHALLDRLSREDPAVADSIRLGSSLRAQFSPELVAAALTQHELRRAAESKFSKAGQMLFTRPGLEQASAEVVSRYRAPRYAGLGRLA
ncbi:MAG: class I SAM-dependent methyltransferase, partial [Pseudonocardiaceae bacterium]